MMWIVRVGLAVLGVVAFYALVQAAPACKSNVDQNMAFSVVFGRC